MLCVVPEIEIPLQSLYTFNVKIYSPTGPLAGFVIQVHVISPPIKWDALAGTKKINVTNIIKNSFFISIIFYKVIILLLFLCLCFINTYLILLYSIILKG